jgi:hypothetical protein
MVVSGGCQGAYSEFQRRRVERCKIEDMNCREETPVPVGWESWETRAFNRANGVKFCMRTMSTNIEVLGYKDCLS